MNDTTQHETTPNVPTICVRLTYFSYLLKNFKELFKINYFLDKSQFMWP